MWKGQNDGFPKTDKHCIGIFKILPLGGVPTKSGREVSVPTVLYYEYTRIPPPPLRGPPPHGGGTFASVFLGGVRNCELKHLLSFRGSVSDRGNPLTKSVLGMKFVMDAHASLSMTMFFFVFLSVIANNETVKNICTGCVNVIKYVHK